MSEDCAKKVSNQLNTMLDQYGALIFGVVIDMIEEAKEGYTRKLNMAVWDGNYKKSLRLTGSLQALNHLEEQLQALKDQQGDPD